MENKYFSRLKSRRSSCDIIWQDRQRLEVLVIGGFTTSSANYFVVHLFCEVLSLITCS